MTRVIRSAAAALAAFGLILAAMLAVAPSANAAESRPAYGRCGANSVGLLIGWGWWGRILVDLGMYESGWGGFGCDKSPSW